MLLIFYSFSFYFNKCKNYLQVLLLICDSMAIDSSTEDSLIIVVFQKFNLPVEEGLWYIMSEVL